MRSAPCSASAAWLARLLAAALAASALASTGAASAAPNDPEGKLVKDMLKDAIAAERAGKCKESLGILRQAAAIRETGEVLLHVGECQARGGSLLEALKTWENAEDVARNEHDKATLAELVPRMDALRGRIPTVLLHVPKDATHALVKIDDQPEPPERVATPILLNPGDHTITVTADGRAQFSAKITLAEKEAKLIDVALPSTTGPRSGGEGDAGVAARDQPAVPLGTWIAGGAAVVLLAGGIISFVAAGSAASDGQKACATALVCDPSQKSSVHTLDTLALTMWVGAGASAGFATTWFFLNRPKKRPAAEPAPAAEAPSASLRVGPGSAWLHASF